LRNSKNVRGTGQAGGGSGLPSDNSNTQFAVLALWVARVHDIPVDYPLLLAEWRFRSTQRQDGGWSYGMNLGNSNEGSTPSMTCAGLLGLAIAYGTKREQAALLRAGQDSLEGSEVRPQPQPRMDIDSDPQVLSARNYIASALTKAPKDIPHFLYFLWSLERVSVTYRWKEYNGIDWYNYGANILLRSQSPSGAWHIDSTGSPNVDTAFALLFLRKANLVGDISGMAVIRSGSYDPLKAATTNDPITGSAKKPATNRPVREIAPDKAEAEAKKLSGEFLVSRPQRQREILEILQETKDSTGNFTQALIDLLGQAKEEHRDMIRQALAERLSRQTLASLLKRASEEDPEVRRAAIRAMAIKGDQKAMPELVKFLTDRDEDIAEAAEEALKALSEGKDFGRNPQRWQEYIDKLRIR